MSPTSSKTTMEPAAAPVTGTLTKHKKIAFTAIEQQLIELQSVGEDIWRAKEDPGKEDKSHNTIVNFLKKKGFKVQDQYMGFATAFRAEFGEGELGGNAHPNIGLMCQYDAEPGRGHSWGHNLVTVNALTAALGLQCVIKFATEPMGKVTVIGCASNLDKTAKIAMFEADAFRKIDFILSAYPANYTNVSPHFVASKSYSVLYKGRSRADNNRSWEAANPVNAAVIAYQNVSAARGNFLNDWVAKGVITSAGHKADMIPDHATMEWILQAPQPEDMKHLDNKINECLQAAATATGCQVDVKQTKAEYLNNITCPRLSELYINNARLNGFTFHNFKTELEGPDDVANVSTSIPVLKIIYYDGDSSLPGTDEFNRYVGSKDCQFMSVVQGKTLAMLGVDLMTSDNEMKVIFEQHQAELINLYGGSKPGQADIVGI